ncbi:MAG TPA: MaoC/PaaZ C-terminal domain-containing protein [Candidatus Sulfotelmatobacter sp.]|nr:MaoC/PaaZ C-terminal domain-containing protein [Candidatus Sulfotelmatobacter sp.]
MAIDYQKLMHWPFKDVEHTYTARDTMLYALGLGMGADPLDEQQLRFVYEEKLQALPTMAAVLGGLGFWVKDPESGVDWKKVLHGEQGLVVHKPLPPSGTVVGKAKITEIVDKGAGKGALCYSKRDIFDKKTGDLLCTVNSCSFWRGDGGFGGPTGPTPKPHAVPESKPDAGLDIKTLPQAALIYRLSGDYNPLHADPAVAKAGGFPKPILHGLCTYGVAGRALLQLAGGYDPSRIRRMDVRFTSPVFPGETIRTEIWREGGGKVAFRSKVVERDVVVLNNGYAEIAA